MQSVGINAGILELVAYRPTWRWQNSCCAFLFRTLCSIYNIYIYIYYTIYI